MKISHCLLGMVLALGFGNCANAETLLKIKLKFCERESEGSVICDFRLKSPISRSMTMTGGQYTQATDSFGAVYDATTVQIGEVSGLAIKFEIFRGKLTRGRITFEGVNPSIETFSLVTMRFSDGYWKKNQILVKSDN